jgi:hypothetical protein
MPLSLLHHRKMVKERKCRSEEEEGEDTTLII